MGHVAAGGFANLPEPWASVVIGVIAIVVIAWIAVLVSVLRQVIHSPMDNGMKVVWVALILGTHIFGVILWFRVGRRNGERLAR